MNERFYEPEDLLEVADRSVLIDADGLAWQVDFPDLVPASDDEETVQIPDGLEDYPAFPFTLVFDGDDLDELLDIDGDNEYYDPDYCEQCNDYHDFDDYDAIYSDYDDLADKAENGDLPPIPGTTVRHDSEN